MLADERMARRSGYEGLIELVRLSGLLLDHRAERDDGRQHFAHVGLHHRVRVKVVPSQIVQLKEAADVRLVCAMVLGLKGEAERG